MPVTYHGQQIRLSATDPVRWQTRTKVRKAAGPVPHYLLAKHQLHKRMGTQMFDAGSLVTRRHGRCDDRAGRIGLRALSALGTAGWPEPIRRPVAASGATANRESLSVPASSATHGGSRLQRVGGTHSAAQVIGQLGSGCIVRSAIDRASFHVSRAQPTRTYTTVQRRAFRRAVRGSSAFDTSLASGRALGTSPTMSVSHGKIKQPKHSHLHRRVHANRHKATTDLGISPAVPPDLHVAACRSNDRWG